MKQQDIPTALVGAEEAHAIAGFPGCGLIADQPHFQPVTRRALMTAVNTVGKELGLRPANVVVLDALLSCLPCQDAKGTERPISPQMLLTVYASNETLCFRAKGITDRQLRRHLDKLESLGLIRRLDSANGKRFPILRKGLVVGAFGLDLSPLLVRAGALMARSEETRAEAQELRGLRGIMLKLRQQCLMQDLGEAVMAEVEGMARVLRRAGTTLGMARAMLARLRSILSESSAVSDQTTASDGQNVRHKETENPETQISPATLWQRLVALPAFFPQMPQTEHGFLQLLYDVGKMLRMEAGLLAQAVARKGLAEILILTDRIVESGGEIRNPQAYLMGCLAKVGHGQPG